MKQVIKNGEFLKRCNIEHTFNVHFNDDNSSNDKGFELSFDEALSYIQQHNGTKESYFSDYKGGMVSIVNNNTEEVVFETEVL